MNDKIQKSNNKGVTKSHIGKLDLAGINTKALDKSLSGLSLPRLYYQLVIFVLDASQSMTREGISGKGKGEEIHDQITPIIERLKSSKNANSFDISMFAFSQTHIEFIKQTSIANIDLDTTSFNPCDYVGNYQTYIESALIDVERKVLNYLNKHKDKNSQAMIVILGDGDFHDYPKSVVICDRLKKDHKVTIASYLLEDTAWKEILSTEKLDKLRNNIKNLSSKDNNGINFFESKVNPEEIRKHMIKSISTVSKID